MTACVRAASCPQVAPLILPRMLFLSPETAACCHMHLEAAQLAGPYEGNPPAGMDPAKRAPAISARPQVIANSDSEGPSDTAHEPASRAAGVEQRTLAQPSSAAAIVAGVSLLQPEPVTALPGTGISECLAPQAAAALIPHLRVRTQHSLLRVCQVLPRGRPGMISANRRRGLVQQPQRTGRWKQRKDLQQVPGMVRELHSIPLLPWKLGPPAVLLPPLAATETCRNRCLSALAATEADAAVCLHRVSASQVAHAEQAVTMLVNQLIPVDLGGAQGKAGAGCPASQSSGREG